MLMLDRIDLEPLFFAPFVSSVMKVEQSWIDYNGHLNMAYYNVLFDRCVDEAYELLGIGLEYLKSRQHSTFTAEAHVRYLRELREDGGIDGRNKNIKNHGQKFTLRLLQHLASKGTVTLLCHCAEDELHCHRHLLKKVLEGKV